MKQKRWIKIPTILIIFALAITMLMPVSSQALSSLDPNKACTLNIYFEPGVSAFKLYRVADINSSGSFTMNDTFARFYAGSTGAKVNNLDANGYVTLANELKRLIHQNPIDPIAEIETDEDGHGAFEDISAGMYLLLKPKMKSNDVSYLEAAQIITLPSRIPDEDGNLGDWVYDVVANVKFLPEEDYLNTDIEVEKQWDFSNAPDITDEEKEELKQEVVVELRVDPGDGSYPWPIYDDGSDTDYGHIVLNEENGWKQVFEQINLADGSWEFEEVSSPDNFVALDPIQDGNVTIITNQYIPPTEENSTEDSEDSPPPTTSTKTTTPPTTTKTKLPQTGQLWWPVPVLAGIGLALFGVGAMKNKKYHKSSKKS